MQFRPEKWAEFYRLHAAEAMSLLSSTRIQPPTFRNSRLAATAKRRIATRTKPTPSSGEPSRDDANDPSGIDQKPPRHRGFSQRIVLVAGLFLAGILLVWFTQGGDPRSVESISEVAIPKKYNSDRAMGYLKHLCDFGPRPSGSPAMQAQQDALQKFFALRGADVVRQEFQTRHPETGEPVAMANLIARWGINRPKRFLFCAHYDTRPFPDRDRNNRKGVFIGANDGASGTAGLMELSHHFADLPEDIGIDLVLFDGEEFVFEQGRDDYFLGSTHFAKSYQLNPPPIAYEAGVLLDMIGDRELKIYYEQNSMKYARDVAKSVWKTAKRLKVKAFIPRIRHNVSDDHLPLNNLAKIPTIDLIDFDYPRPGLGQPSYWHTEQDVPENCSGESIAVVVWVLHQWILNQ